MFFADSNGLCGVKGFGTDSYGRIWGTDYTDSYGRSSGTDLPDSKIALLPPTSLIRSELASAAESVKSVPAVAQRPN